MREGNTVTKICLRVLVALPLAAFALNALAQTYGAPISLDQARKVMAAAEAEAKKNNWTMAIAIVTPGVTWCCSSEWTALSLSAIG